jgi:hypothetical protein
MLDQGVMMVDTAGGQSWSLPVVVTFGDGPRFQGVAEARFPIRRPGRQHPLIPGRGGAVDASSVMWAFFQAHPRAFARPAPRGA